LLLLLKIIYTVGLACVLGLSITLWGIFSWDLAILTMKLMKSLSVSFLLPARVPILITVAFCSTVTLIYLLTYYKWVVYCTEILAPVYSSSQLLSIKNGEKGTLGEYERKLSLYRSIYVFINLVNEFSSVPFISFKFITILTSSLGFTICLIYKISVPTISLFALSCLMLMFVNYEFSFAYSTLKFSNEFIEGLKGNPHAGTSRQDFLFNHRSILSLRECRLYCGSQYFVDRNVLLKINIAVLNYTVSNVMLLKGMR